ncbi:IDEAL domain-containing protein [Ornithinibacillus scapharcae]|uniref:IDEAL domain-containing protein n=1 Tax=Ornithinibacillus scapharcae TaxID=1147159 RepID=UPI000225B7E2|nr:IDEAL domain-containing protein [Ornithinibacillus scapharcae]
MISVKMLKPYYIKADDQYVRIILAYQYFSVLIDKQLYQFIPIEAKEFRINRRTRQVENIGSRFAFQKGKDVVYMTMTELMTLPDFVQQLDHIVSPYYSEGFNQGETENLNIIEKLEKANVQRLIDKALDERDEKSFRELVKLL